MNLSNFIYLFLVDLIRAPLLQDTYQDFIEREPGYSTCLLEAYITAFNEPKDGKLTHELIKKINRTAMSFKKKYAPGEYKTSPGSFPIYLNSSFNLKEQPIKRVTCNATTRGIAEFLNHHFRATDYPVHMVAFEKQLDQNIGFVIEKHKNNTTSFELTFVTNAIVSAPREVSFGEVVRYIKKSLNTSLYNCSISTMSRIPPAITPTVVTQCMERIFSAYDNQISKARSNDEKITAIVTAIQHITQLHPFLDGNIRTCYVLLNKLLRDNNLSLTLLIDPNRFDCYANHELVTMVKQGQNHFQQLMAMKEGNLILTTYETIQPFRSLILKPQPLLDIEENIINSFIEVITNSNVVLAYDNRNRLFSQTINSSSAYHTEQNDSTPPEENTNGPLAGNG